MKKYYCPCCKKLKSRREVGSKTYLHECKWCHHRVILLEDAIEEILHTYSNYNNIFEKEKK